MNIRFYNAKILILKEDKTFDVISGELWVKGDVICYIGDGAEPTKVLESMVEEPMIWGREIDARGNLLMPGFKNAHSHTAMTFLRSFADDLPLQDWLFSQVFPKEEQLTREIVYDLDILGIMEYLTSGITACFDMYYFPPVNARAAADCGFRMVQVQGINDFGGTLEEMEENYQTINGMSDLTSYMIGLHAEYTTSLKLMEGVAELAHKYQSPVYMHNAETAKEVKECFERYGISPTQLTEKLGMYEYGGGGYHCIYFYDEDFEIFKKRSLNAVTCPASNMKLASGMAPLKRFVEEGINVALGTDGAASNNSLDIFKEMFLASTLAKVREMDAECVGANHILYMATAGGAAAMGLTNCDCLAPGKKADLIMIDLHQPNMQPENNLVKNLVYSGGKQNVAMTMINGKILYERGKFSIGFEPEDVYRRANEIIRAMH